MATITITAEYWADDPDDFNAHATLDGQLIWTSTHSAYEYERFTTEVNNYVLALRANDKQVCTEDIRHYYPYQKEHSIVE